MAPTYGDTITIWRGDTLSQELTIGSVENYVSVDWVVKEKRSDTNENAIIHIRVNKSGEDDGLIILNRSSTVTAANGSITISDEEDGEIVLTLKTADSDDLVPRYGLYYDTQLITATTVTTKTEGWCNIMGDINTAVA
jgi:hypothetical protein